MKVDKIVSEDNRQAPLFFSEANCGYSKCSDLGNTSKQECEAHAFSEGQCEWMPAFDGDAQLTIRAMTVKSLVWEKKDDGSWTSSVVEK